MGVRGIVDRVVAVGGGNARGADPLQRILGRPVDVLEIEVVVVLRRRVGQRPHVLNAVAVADTQALETPLERVVEERGESACVFET